MTVSCVCSAANAQPTKATDGFNQLFTDFKGIGSAIQSGDLTPAQTALTTFQTDLENNTGKNPLSRLFKKHDELGNDLKALSDALATNDPAKGAGGLQDAHQRHAGRAGGAALTWPPPSSSR